MCAVCIDGKRKIKPPEERWKEAGYKKKNSCDLCGFRAKYAAQVLVYHIDGNCNNSQPKNLRTVCQNCVVEVQKSNSVWRPGDLTPDL